MTSFVKRFIEENVESIDQKKYYKMFLNWYSEVDDWPDTALIKDLFDVLRKIDIYPEDTEDARQTVLEGAITDILDFFKNSNEKYFETYRILYRLRSNLGFSVEDVLETTIDIAKSQGLKVDIENRVISK